MEVLYCCVWRALNPADDHYKFKITKPDRVEIYSASVVLAECPGSLVLQHLRPVHNGNNHLFYARIAFNVSEVLKSKLAS